VLFFSVCNLLFMIYIPFLHSGKSIAFTEYYYNLDIPSLMEQKSKLNGWMAMVGLFSLYKCLCSVYRLEISHE